MSRTTAPLHQLPLPLPLLSLHPSRTPTPLLAPIPYNLQLNALALHLNGANLEVNADGGDVRLRVRVVGKSEEQAALPNTRVADQQQLEQIVAERPRQHSAA